MIEITNLKKYPVQLVIKSKKAPNEMTVLNLPGVGKGRNKFLLQDERSTAYIDQAKAKGLIDTKVLN